MDQDHPTVGWVVKMGAEIKIQKDPAVMAHGWLSLQTSLSSCAVADPGSVAIPPNSQQEPQELGSPSPQNLYKVVVGAAARGNTWHCWREDIYPHIQNTPQQSNPDGQLSCRE